MTPLLEAKAQDASQNRARPWNQRRSIGIEIKKRIDLSKPYEAGLATVLSLPTIHQNRKEKECLSKEFRNLYQAANGRHVSTALGPIPIAPAVAPWLKDAPLFFATREEFSGFVAKLSAASRDGLSKRGRPHWKERRRI